MDNRKYFEGLNISQEASMAHDIAAYEQAAGVIGLKPNEFMGHGMESAVFGLEGNKVLKFTEQATDPLVGTRPFDLPLLSQGKVTLNAGTNYSRDIFYQVQPRAQSMEAFQGPIARQMEASFAKSVVESGYELVDPGIHQLGLYEGKPHLMDYFAVESPRGGLVDPSTPGLRPAVPQSIHEVAAPPGSPMRMSRWEKDKSVADSIRGTPDAETMRALLSKDIESSTQRGWVMSVPGYRGRVQMAITHEELQRRGFEVGESDQLGRFPVTKITTEEAKTFTQVAQHQSESSLLKVVERETLNEHHVNLESKIGGFLKKAMRLPFKGRSRLDPLAAALQASETSIGSRSFMGISYGGIITTGVLALGASITLAGWKKVSDSVGREQQDWQYIVPPSPQSSLHGNSDMFSIHRTQTQGPDGSTRLHVDDAILNHEVVDEAFTKHLKYGLAHSSR